jgi:hypothetical protein
MIKEEGSESILSVCCVGMDWVDMEIGCFVLIIGCFAYFLDVLANLEAGAVPCSCCGDGCYGSRQNDRPGLGSRRHFDSNLIYSMFKDV